MVSGKAVHLRMGSYVVQPQRFRVVDEQAKNPVATRGFPDQATLLGSDAVRDELAESRPIRCQHTERSVARIRQLAGGLDDSLERVVEIQLTGHRKHSIQKHV